MPIQLTTATTDPAQKPVIENQEIQVISDREAAVIAEHVIPGQCARIFCANGSITSGMIYTTVLYARAGDPDVINLMTYLATRQEQQRMGLIENWLR